MFFKQFPKTSYSIENDAIRTEVTDYFRYVDVIDKFAYDLYSYQNVDIIDGERPDNLSQRLYGTPDYYWTFFIVNDDLKNGLSSWPKSASELSKHTTNQFNKLSAFRFPLVENKPSEGDRTTPLGIPITNGYLPYLRLCFLIDSFSNVDGVPVKIFANAKIADFKPNLSQIWIDNTTFTWSSDVDAYNDQVGDGGTLDKQYSAEAKTAMFNASTIEKEFFSIQFFEDSSTVVGLKSAFIEEVRETAIQLQPACAAAYRNMTLSKFEKSYTITNSEVWKDAKTAPAYYYDPDNINSVISEYMTLPGSTSYVSYEDEIIEKNDDRQIIKVIAPSYIDSFARDYKRLSNE
tara:strand:+ start:146 stop:1186 length:1041 start_codon:yes stop_codon:yes gene_type:complete